MLPMEHRGVVVRVGRLDRMRLGVNVRVGVVVAGRAGGSHSPAHRHALAPTVGRAGGLAGGAGGRAGRGDADVAPQNVEVVVVGEGRALWAEKGGSALEWGVRD